MKPTSPLSLLVFLQLTAGVRAAPIPLQSDCLHYASCDPALQELLTEIALSTKGHSPPPSRPLSDPHFPSHQLDNGLPRATPLHPALPSHPSPEDAFNNAPITPPSAISPHKALSAKVPLQSSYLLSLSSSTHANLAAKPTSALPSLREEDTRRYWEAILRGDKVTVEEQDNKMIESMRAPKCSHLGMFASMEHTTVGWKATKAREYSDLLVVGIVVLFLFAVIMVEAVEKIGDLRHAVFGSSRGAIRLDDEEALFIVKKPFYLQPAPKTRYKIRAMHDRKTSSYSDNETDVSSFKYDSDANEKQ